MKSAKASTCSQLLMTLILVIFLPLPGHAQTPESSTSETAGPKRFWQASVPGGSYAVALERIVSVSKHSYIMAGNIRVSEVVIDTGGSTLARFYHQQAVEKNTPDPSAGPTGLVGDSVAKPHPANPGAKMVEYRIPEAADLDKLFDSVRNAWINGKGKRFTIKSGG